MYRCMYSQDERDLMRNLLHQLKRVGKHMKSIIMKLMSKMMKGASLSAKTIVLVFATIIIAPIVFLLYGMVVFISILFLVLGGAPVDIEHTNPTLLTVQQNV